MAVMDREKAERKYVRLVRELSRREDWQYYMAPKSRSNAVYALKEISTLEGRLAAFRKVFRFSAADVRRMKKSAGYRTLEEKYGLA